MSSITAADGLDVGSIRLFLDVVELGSVSGAATRHRLAQPSATARLQKLERQLGVQLLERGPGGSTATGAGTRLTSACADVVTAAMALVDRAGEVVVEQQHLLLATTRHVADHFLPMWIDAAELDRVRIDLVEDDTLAVAQSVRAGTADVGFVDGPAAPVGLRSRVVGSEEVVAVVGRQHPWHGRRRAVSGAQLVAETLVLPAAGSGTRDVITAALAPFAAGSVGDRIDTTSSAAARVAALAGPTVALLPRCRVDGDLERGALSEVAVRDVSIHQPVRAVWRGAQPPVRVARRFVATLPSP
jgi:molybdate transport repressor ModE-like protein